MQEKGIFPICWYCLYAENFTSKDRDGRPLEVDLQVSPPGRKGRCTAATKGVHELSEGTWVHLDKDKLFHEISSQGMCNLSKTPDVFNPLFILKPELSQLLKY